MSQLDARQEQRLYEFSLALVDQTAARIIIEPQQHASGFWFGGGNMVQAADGNLYIVGRYRNAGDSRTGISAGERGLELAIFRSKNRGSSWEKAASWSKADLDVGSRNVLSIEGAALSIRPDGIELFVSTEKDHLGYPAGFENYLKPRTGVWTIERLAAGTIEHLKQSAPETVLESSDPAFVHIKDPFVHQTPEGDLQLLFCSHPFCWTSSNTGYTVRKKNASAFGEAVYDFFPRGTTWDVAMTRGTCVLDVPRVGLFAETNVSLIFYDGGECVRNLDEHATAVKRPRGYSCEELGGLAYFTDGKLEEIVRLSRYEPAFVSPTGTGCSRYVDVLSTDEGLYVTWQQSQSDYSQPLVMNFVPREKVEALLS